MPCCFRFNRVHHAANAHHVYRSLSSPRFLLGLVCSLLWGIFCTSLHAEPRLLRVGYVLDRSGPLVNDSRDFFAGAKVLLDEFNAKAGDKTIRQLVRESDGTPERTLQAALELARDDKVDVIVGLAGDAALSALVDSPAFAREGVPLLAPLSGLRLPAASLGGRVFFSRADYGQEIQYVVRYLRGVGLSRVVLVTQAGRPTGLQQAVRSAFTLAAAKTANQAALTVDEIVLPAAGAARQTELQRMAQTQAQALIVLGDSLDYAAVFQAYRRLSLGATVIGLSTVNPRTVLELVPSTKMSGAMLTQVMLNPVKTAIPLSREFERVFKKYFDEPPSHQSLAGFVAAHQLLAALGRISGPLNRVTLTSALQATVRLDVYGFEINYATVPQRGSEFVDLLMIRADGKLLQ